MRFVAGGHRIGGPPHASQLYRFYPNCYRGRYRWLGLLRLGKPVLLVPLNRSCKVFRTDEPRQEHFQAAVSRACAYPAGVLSSEVDYLCRALEARVCLWFSEIAGVLRERHTDQCSGATIEYSNTQNGAPTSEDHSVDC
jgi:hypothetical protein